MREIKFRAWHEPNKTMVYFNPKRLTEDHFQATYLVKLMNGDFGAVLMQYTGLKDKNGKEIYEGDILDTSNDGLDGCDVWSFGEYELKVITWSDNYHRWIDLPDKNEYSTVFSPQYTEIIGNIHENPELLELIK